jgi:hypothetical protein
MLNERANATKSVDYIRNILYSKANFFIPRIFDCNIEKTPQAKPHARFYGFVWQLLNGTSYQE